MLRWIVVLALAAGCGSTKVEKKIELVALAPDAPVTVHNRAPNFDYEVICEINVSRSGSTIFVDTDGAAYDDILSSEARKCGASEVLNTGARGFTTTYGSGGSSANVYVKGLAFRQKSEVQKIATENYKKIGIAASAGNVPALQKLLSGLNTDRSKRFSLDSHLLDVLLYNEAKSGNRCSIKTIAYLERLNAKLLWVKLPEKLGGTLLENGDFTQCHGLLRKHYYEVENRQELLVHINNKTVSVLDHFTGSSKDVGLIRELVPLNALARQEINASCKVSDTDETCLLKPRFQEIGAALGKLLPKYQTRPAISAPLFELKKQVDV